MITPDYYPLKQAAEILDCSEDTLIHFGAMGKLPIYILTFNFSVEMLEMVPGGEPIPFMVTGIKSRLAKLWRLCLLELEAGDVNAEALIEPEYIENELGHHIREYRYQLKRKYRRYPSADEMLEAQKKGFDMDKIYPAPILIKECKLVILNNDLICLQESEIKPEMVTAIIDRGQSENLTTDASLTKLEKQQQAILKIIDQKQFKPLEIPDGEKGTIELICKSDYPKLFDGESSFNNAWKKSHLLFRMANYASYAKRGKN